MLFLEYNPCISDTIYVSLIGTTKIPTSSSKLFAPWMLPLCPTREADTCVISYLSLRKLLKVKNFVCCTILSKSKFG